MPEIIRDGFRLTYQETGNGVPVVLVMGTGGSGRAWHLHQVPALAAAGHRVVTFDNRGVSPSDGSPPGFTVADMAADVAALIEHLGIGPCAVVGTSLGARIAAELALARPELVSRLVLMAARGRSDAMSTALTRAERELEDLGIELPPRYRAVVQVLQQLSRRSLADDRRTTDWLEVFELSTAAESTVRAQRGLYPMPDRLPAYRGIRAPSHVVSFSDDVLAPPSAGREIAAAIPGATFEVVDGCGHIGYLEHPDTVNRILLAALRPAREPGVPAPV
ncbi:alpha/beta fold hydrolase [Streptomyces acidiscabies]|uniref:alpha/beta fold hydrolase n=1 Tax=Streptomyces acidiscabies TaxID=42234 RepID=UPI00073E2B80|nr:alpha/beta hydrolase [Streptomyces acidiscabies]GAQ50742.1 putative non-heme bromoperoxidase BpoC [Streptomyces acidiscabies]GAV39191.1 putative non-heme bromoperoxidase BpoC [Streptomyces acidiscabies]